MRAETVNSGNDAGPFVLATLICRAHMGIGLPCLRSLREACQTKHRFVIFEDGSLEDDDVAELARALPGMELVRRKELDGLTEDALSNMPNVRKHRAVNATMLKIVDIPMRMQEPFLFVDSDILFFKKFGLGELPSAARDHFVFMQDLKEAYSARIYRLASQLRMPSRLNSGIMCIPPGRFDLDFVEWFLSKPEYCEFPSVVEQTIWAGMTRNDRVLFADPKQIYCWDRSRSADRETVAIHYPSALKAKLPGAYAAAEEGRSGQAVAELRLVQPARLSWGSVLANGIRNRLLKA